MNPGHPCASTAWIVSQHIDNNKNTKATLKSCYGAAVIWELSPGMIHLFHYSIHPLKIEIKPPKTMCGCTCGGI